MKKEEKMKFQSRRSEDRIVELRAALDAAMEEKDREKRELVSLRSRKGWRHYYFISEDIGCDLDAFVFVPAEEQEQYIREREFLFGPTVVLPWPGPFSHGPHGVSEDNVKFCQWLKTIDEAQYVEL